MRKPGSGRKFKEDDLPNYSIQELREKFGHDIKLYKRMYARVRYKYNSQHVEGHAKSVNKYLAKKRALIVDLRRKQQFQHIQRILLPLIKRKIRLDSFLSKITPLGIVQTNEIKPISQVP
jgi:hypothetical protein